MNYRQKFYEIYKQMWLRRNVKDNELKRAIMGDYENDHNFQFKYGMYVCYDEFINNDFQDVEVMKFILNDDELYEIYLREKDNEKENLIDKIIKDSDCEYYDRICNWLENRNLTWDDNFNITEINDMCYSKKTYTLRNYLNLLTIEDLRYLAQKDEEDE